MNVEGNYVAPLEHIILVLIQPVCVRSSLRAAWLVEQQLQCYSLCFDSTN